MERKFYVNEDKRHTLIKEQEKKAGLGYKILLLIARLLVLIAILLILGSIIIPILYKDLSVLFGFFAVAIIFASIFWGISYLIKFLADRKWLRRWKNNRFEELLLTESYIVHECYHKYDDEWYRVRKMTYEDIVKLEYDKKEECLRVYGPTSDKLYFDSSKSKMYSSIKPQEKGTMRTCLTLVNYFDNFEDIIRILEEKTGMKIVYK